MKNQLSRMYTAVVTVAAMVISSTILSAQIPVLFTDTFNSAPNLSASQDSGAWYPDRFRPSVFEKTSLNGENVLHVGIRLTDSYANRPPENHSSFYNTQGRKYDLGRGNSFSTSVIADVFIDSNWNSEHRMATLWSTACDSIGAPSFYNIFGFRNSTGANPGFYIYGIQNIGAYTLIPFPITYGQWYSLKIELTDTAFVYSINGIVVLSDTTLNGTEYFSNIMVQAYNFADSTLPVSDQSFDEYDVYWDNVGATDRPLIHFNPAPVNLLTAGNFRVLAGSAITIAVGTTISGNAGISPGSSITNGGIVTGNIHLNDSSAVKAQNDLTTVFTSVVSRTADTTIGSELGGITLGRGVYISAAGTFGITGTLTLEGSATDIFIFKTASTLTTGANSKVILEGGATSSNIFWLVGSSATIGGDFSGNILALTAITQNIGASINGRTLARNSFVTLNGISVLPVTDDVSGAPQLFALNQNYPNPFNPSTTISFNVPVQSFVTIHIFDALGREVSVLVSEEFSAGRYSKQWNASALPSGIYFYRIHAGSFADTKKLLLLR